MIETKTNEVQNNSGEIQPLLATVLRPQMASEALELIEQGKAFGGDLNH